VEPGAALGTVRRSINIKLNEYIHLNGTTDDDIEDYEEQVIIVKFQISGKFIPQTLYEPAEYPELEVLSVTLDDNCIVDDLQEVHNKEIDGLCWQHLADLKEASYEDHETR
jgi:hypothetical protein